MKPQVESPKFDFNGTPPTEAVYLIIKVKFENDVEMNYRTRIYDFNHISYYERSLQKVYDKLRTKGDTELGVKATDLVATWIGTIDSEPANG